VWLKQKNKVPKRRVEKRRRFGERYEPSEEKRKQEFRRPRGQRLKKSGSGWV